MFKGANIFSTSLTLVLGLNFLFSLALVLIFINFSSSLTSDNTQLISELTAIETRANEYSERLHGIESINEKSLALIEEVKDELDTLKKDILVQEGEIFQRYQNFNNSTALIDDSVLAVAELPQVSHGFDPFTPYVIGDVSGQQVSAQVVEDPPIPLAQQSVDDGIGKAPTDLNLRRVYYGTNRHKAEDAISHWAFGPDRGSELLLGFTDISIPKNRIAGTIDRPERWNFLSIPLPIKESESIEKHFVEYETKELSESEFKKEVAKAAVSEAAEKSAIIYIHGFNNTFQDAMFRAAQLGEDLKFDGLVFAFSWPARGGVNDYVTDLDSAWLAVEYLDQFLDLIAEEDDIKKVHLIVHSMGNALLSHLVQRNGTRLSKQQGKLIDQLILAAPDIDREVFREVSEHFKRHSEAVTLYASSADIALHVSEQIRGEYPRAGDVPDAGPLIIDGIDTMDVSVVESGLFGLKHSTYGDSDQVINDVIQRIRKFDQPPHKRITNVVQIEIPNVGIYYKFAPVAR
ncbi:MAG: alpha/beta hydrolase [Pseudomonadota bacterium]